ncbi:helix-turn-helix domain-containing protein [Bacillus horti]|uniref:AraC-like DNA-binding protein n=1 Tax=Caldalkalibacillus horti TaxID=77523 RepID=A0ABT9VWH5_9BACI|nr:helix-turn-helix domain-containing protein [Bacillus horti]MDQ0165343.1 AraC-like DNA-binding protein [Bacillus horti]
MVKDMNSSSTRGILRAAAGKEKFTLSRFEPDSTLKPFVEHYWVIRFNLQDESPYTQKVLSYPNVHLAFEQDEEGRRALVYGIPRKPFVRELSGVGHVLGIKFHAGGFYPFWLQDVSLLTGTTIGASRVFGQEGEAWLDAILDAGSDAAMATVAENVLLERLPESDLQAELSTAIVQETLNDRTIIKVEQLSTRTGLSIRQLQRLFRKYIGVTPKWVIKRFRLQEAAERLERDESLQWAEIAVQLGYFDQAHFIKDFKAVIGQSPNTYRQHLDTQ